MKNKKAIIIILILIIISVILFLTNQSKDSLVTNEIDSTKKSPTVSDTSQNSEETSSSETPTTKPNSGNIVSYTIDAKNFKFSKENITASAGDTVRITLTNSGGGHNLTISEISQASTQTISKGETQTIEFKIPYNPKDSYAFFCSVGNHRALGMEGALSIN